MGSRQSLELIIVLAVSVGQLSSADEKEPAIDPERADSILSDAPLTIVFRKVNERPLPGNPSTHTFSINSAGQVELTTEFELDLPVSKSKKPSRTKFEVPTEKMEAIRKALRDERFFNLPKVDGTHAIHGGWSTLTVSAGALTNIEELYSGDWRHWKKEDQRSAVRSIRLFLVLCKAVDPDAKIFTEQPKVAEIIREIEK